MPVFGLSPQATVTNGTMVEMKREIVSETAMKEFGKSLGALLRGGEVIELVGDVGSGKTTLTKGIARGLGVSEDVQSPTFTISRSYGGRGGLQLNHYDFYRLNDAGIMANELREVLGEPGVVTVLEWAQIVGKVLPKNHIVIRITSPSENSRQLDISGDKRLLADL